MPSKLQKAIGAVKDQTSISIAKVASNNTSNLEVAVLKATTHDDVPMDDRYVYEVLQLVSSSKYLAAACARAIGKRIGRTRNWIVALKSLMLVLRIFQDGDPYFPREVLHAMKRGAKILNLTSFRDDSNTSPWDFTAFVRTFALYLDERLECFLTGKLQRRYKHGVREALGHRSQRANEPVREMKPVMLLDRISYWQRLLERAIATRPTGAAKTNRLVQVCLYAIVEESFDLYKDVSDGLALILDSFFHLPHQGCVNAFQICVKASKQYEELSAFYTLCKAIGVGRTSEYPSIQSISEELMEILQEFLKDQSSFTANTKKSPNRLLLLPPPPNVVSRSLSQFSSVTDRTSGSRCTSLEELISATEITMTTPSISIDLEDYSEQFEKKTQKDHTFGRLSDTGSTQSLPISSSIGDLVSLDDWPDNEVELDKSKNQNQEPVQEKKERSVESTSPYKRWETELAECMTMPQILYNNTSNPPNAITEYNQTQKGDQNDPPDASGNGWELALIEDPPMQNTSNAISEHNQAQKGYQNDPLGASGNGWELALIAGRPMQSLNTSGAITEQNQAQKGYQNYPPGASGNGWELALIADPPTSSSGQPMNNDFNLFSLDNLYQMTPAPTSQPYNPFLQDMPGLPAMSIPATPATSLQVNFPVADPFASAPTFQVAAVAPTFQAWEPSFKATDANQIVNDPFAVFSSDQTTGDSLTSRDFLQEQQLWLQNQNKAIAKHMS